MSMDLKEYGITQEELAGVGVLGLADSPNLSALEMQKKFEETAREVIIPKHNALVEALADETAAAGIGAKDPATDGSKSTVQLTLDRLYRNVQQAHEASGSAQNAADAAKQAAAEATEQLKQKAPVNHASTGADYGIADSGRFGHVKLSDSLIEAVGGQGVAASQKAINTVYEYAKTINTKVNAAVSTNNQSLSAAQQAQARANIGAISADDVVVLNGADLAENDPDAKSYVKNRTHWKEKTSKNGVLLEETTVEFRMEMASVSGIGTDGIKKGGKYLVDWNGTRYDCEAYELAGSVCLGNAALLGSETDTGEPFAIEAITADGCTLVKNTSTAESVTLAVTGVENTVWHQLDPRFIPDMYYTEGGGGGEVILPETTLTFDDDGMAVLQDPVALTAGERYTVKIGDLKYAGTAIDMSGEFGDGGVGWINDGADMNTGEGVECMVVVLSEEAAETQGWRTMIGLMTAADTTVTVSVTSGSGETIHKLDNKYLDLAWLPTEERIQRIEKQTVNCIYEYGEMHAGGISLPSFTEKEELIVVVDGTKYPCTVEIVPNTNLPQYPRLYIGNKSLPGAGEDTGEPFAIFGDGLDGIVFSHTAAGAHTVEAYRSEPNKMPAEFLPEPVIVDGSAMTLVTGEDLTLSLTDAFGAAAFAGVIEQLRNGVRVGLTISFQPKTFAGTGDVSAYTMMFSGSTYNGRLQWSGTYIDGSAVHEINVQVDPSTGMLYAMAREVTGSGTGSGSLPEGFDPLAVVSTKAQSFTPEQQAQARTNIGAASKEEAANAGNAASSAGEKAVAAENAAATAKSTAEMAAAAADEAKTEAGEAVQTAAEAKETAEQAAEDAAGAVSAANGAKVAAQTAANTANSAASAANQAVQGAAEAKATAEQAAEDAAAAKSSAEAAEDSAASALAVANQKAPENHASGTDKYGLGSRTDYGHVLIRDTIADTETTGAAASPEGVARAIAAAQQEVLQEVLDAQQADWNQNDAAAANYVKNRTHWVEDGGEVELTNKPSLTLHEQDGAIFGSYIFNGEYVEGETYVIYWNGVRYECVARYWPGSETQICLGNLDKQYGSGDTGEPFYLSKNYGSSTVLIYAYDGTTQLALTVKTFEKVYHKLPEEYLPESVDGVVIRSSTAGSTKKFRLTVDDSGIITATEV